MAVMIDPDERSLLGAALGGNVSRNLKRLTDAIAAPALLIGGSMLVNASRDSGWHHYLGEVMVGAGVLGTLLVGIAALRRAVADASCLFTYFALLSAFAKKFIDL